MSSKTPARPYQVVLYVGPNVPTVEGARVVDLTPPAAEPDAVLETLRAAELAPADLRSKVLFLAEGDDAFHRDAALMAYSALIGFAKRRIDVAFDLDSSPLVFADFHTAMTRTPDLGRPADVVAHLQVGGPERSDVPRVDIATGFNPASVTAIRYARRIRFCAPTTMKLALPQLVAIAALRSRGTNEKLPYLTDGTEPAAAADDPTAVVGVCLNTLRRAAEDLRRSLRTDNRDAVADKVEPSLRQQRLLSAAAVDVEATLRRLGARSKLVDVPDSDSPDGTSVMEVWHCPRPDNHTNGDATPSARVSPLRGEAHAFRCFRCLSEKVDSLRLVMWVKDCSADEAADWILTAA